MKIAIGSDHAGFNYKEKIKEFLEKSGHEVVDFGTDSTESVDYPLFIRPVAEAVARGQFERGIVLGGSGNGEAMVANRIQGIRCALCWNVKAARLARQHNDANMLSLGERMISIKTAFNIVKTWMDIPFDGGRHSKRIVQIDEVQSSDIVSAPSTGDKQQRSFQKTDAEKAISMQDSTKEWDILIAFRFIKYIEGDKFVEFNVDPGLKSPTVIHVPSPERWEQEMPEWVRGRRDEILGKVKPKCAHIKPEWREY